MSATEQSTKDVKRVAVISNNIREALRNALPAPAEQFLTVSVPGKVIKFDVRIVWSSCLSADFGNSRIMEFCRISWEALIL